MNNDPFLRMFYCRHLQDHGTCRFNASCMFSHQGSAYKVPDHVCVYNLKKYCRNNNCSFLHISASDLIAQLRVLMNYSKGEDEASTSVDRPKSAYRDNRKNADFKKLPLKPHIERLCGICLEDVIGEKRFGLLSSCDHTFCFDCIMQWRRTRNTANESDTKNCPECVQPSDLVVPSRHYAYGDERRRLVDEFKKRNKEKMCKYERDGQNNCRNRNCMFKHTLPFKVTVRRVDLPRTRYEYNLTNANLILNYDSIFEDSSDDDIHISFLDAFM